MDKLVGTFDTKRGHEQVRVYVTDNGKTSISVRMYSYRKGDWHLTKKGVTVPQTKVYKLARLLEKATEFLGNGSLQNTITS